MSRPQANEDLAAIVQSGKSRPIRKWLLIGTTLVAEGFHVHFQKGFVYFAMAFSVFVEMLNVRMKTNAERKAALAKAGH